MTSHTASYTIKIIGKLIKLRIPIIYNVKPTQMKVKYCPERQEFEIECIDQSPDSNDPKMLYEDVVE